MLAEFGAEGMSGRGTRVWKVRRKEDTEEDRTYVLKDSWINGDRAREGATLDDIRGKAPDELKKHFLTPLHHGDVRNPDDGLSTDDTKSMNRGGPLRSSGSLSLEEDSIVGAVTPGGKRTHPSGHVCLPHNLEPPPDVSPVGSTSSTHRRRSKLRRRDSPSDALSNRVRRIRPCASRTDHIRRTDDCADWLYHGCASSRRFLVCVPRASDGRSLISALEVMHKQRYVHRDVSRGNILLVKQKDGTLVGVLIDFEYAIKIDAGGKHVDRSVVRITFLLLCQRVTLNYIRGRLISSHTRFLATDIFIYQ